jgi:hypothetical protein
MQMCKEVFDHALSFEEKSVNAEDVVRVNSTTGVS